MNFTDIIIYTLNYFYFFKVDNSICLVSCVVIGSINTNYSYLYISESRVVYKVFLQMDERRLDRLCAKLMT